MVKTLCESNMKVRDLRAAALRVVAGEVERRGVLSNLWSIGSSLARERASLRKKLSHSETGRWRTWGKFSHRGAVGVPGLGDRIVSWRAGWWGRWDR